MLSKLPQPTQLHKRMTTFNSFGSLQGIEERPSEERHEFIPSLISKFANLSSQIEIQHNISSFNLIEYEKDAGKVKVDEHIAAAKLKRIENNAELKRANNELFIRKRKMYKIKEERQKEKQAESNKEAAKEEQKEEYRDIFKTFAEAQTQRHVEEENDSFEEEEPPKPPNPDTKPPPPEGILYFEELKKHPKLLHYTIEKVKEKHLKSDLVKFEKRDRILKFRNEMRTVSHSEPRMASRAKLPSEPDQQQPQAIFENIFRKIYTKKNHNRSLSQVRNDQRLSTFITKQDEILEGINENALSKQNYKRLKERFGDLLNELYQVDKKHRIQEQYQKKLNHTVALFRHSPQLS